MNEPSPEQQFVIDKLDEGINVICSAVAGSGKSSTILSMAKQLNKRKIIQLTYNAELRSENIEKVVLLELENIEVHTFHSLGYHYYSKDCNTDSGIRDVLNQEMMPIQAIDDFDMCVLDEYQDNTSLYYRFICKFLRDSGKKVQLLILGDVRQSLYEFKGSESRFLSMGEKVWGNFELLKNREFLHTTLRMSYRITDTISSFVNENMLGENIMISCKPGEPVVYYRGSPHNAGKYIVNNINELLESGVKPNDIFILSASVKSQVVKTIENTLVENNIPCYVPTFDIGKLDKRIISGKVVFSTFHSSKGRQRPYVFVLGFDNDYYKRFARDEENKTMCPNVFYVATTRALKKLIVIEFENNLYSRPLEFLKMGHHDMKRSKFIDFKGVPRHIFYKEKDEVDENLITIKKVCASGLVSFIPDSTIEIITPFIEKIFIPINDNNQKILALEIPNIIHTKAGLFEGVSDLNGIAIPCMFYDNLYNEFYPDKENPGNTIYNRINLLLLESRSDEHSYIKEFVDRLPNPCSSIQDYLLLSNVLSSIEENLNYRLKQIKIDDYDWLSDDLINNCLIRYKNAVSDDILEGSLFEAEKFFISPSMIGEQDKINDILSPHFYNTRFEVSGIIDLITEKSVYEFKCTNILSQEHKIQLVFYAWVYKILYPDDIKKFKLYNVKNNESYIIESTFEELNTIVLTILKGKYEKIIKKSDEEFLSEFQ